MNEKEPKNTPTPKEIGKTTLRRRKHVAGNRASAQRDKLDAQAEARAQQATERAVTATEKPRRGQEEPRVPAARPGATATARAIDDYLPGHAGRDHSATTLTRH